MFQPKKQGNSYKDEKYEKSYRFFTWDSMSYGIIFVDLCNQRHYQEISEKIQCRKIVYQ